MYCPWGRARTGGQQCRLLKAPGHLHGLDMGDARTRRNKRRIMCTAGRRKGDVPDPGAAKLPSQLDSITEGVERSFVSVLERGDDDDSKGADLDYLQVSNIGST
jgi:hypothetical protein